MTTILFAPPRDLPESVGLTLLPPPAKSSALRALACAALAGGGAVLGSPLGTPPDGRTRWPEDVTCFVDGLRGLGVGVVATPAGFLVVSGLDRRPSPPRHIDIGEGAAPARFLLALAATSPAPTTVVGRGRLPHRPFDPLILALRGLGADVQGGPGLPVTVTGPLGGGVVTVDGRVSSQFASALLLVAPALETGLRLRFSSGSRVSSSYNGLTAAVMEAFGARVVETDAGWEVAGTGYRPQGFGVPGDWSGGAALLAASAFLNRVVRVPGLELLSGQPDERAFALFQELGMVLAASDGGIFAAGAPTRGGTFDVGDCPDLAPALAALATLAPEPVRIVGAAHLRAKESDRIAGLVHLLRDVGAEASELPDGLLVQGGWSPNPQGDPVPVDVRHDHRLVMAAGLLGLRRPVVVLGASAVSKSFPGFLEQWPGLARF